MLFEKIENNKKAEEEKIDPYFLKDQFWLPNKDDWDESFCKLIKEKSEENQRQLCEAEGEIKNEKNNIPQEILEKKQDYIDRSFNQTLHNLGFKKDDLRDKRVLDLGFGDGIFVRELIKNNITKEAFGLDLNINNDLIKKEFKDHFFQGDFQEEFPVKDVDYVVSNGAVSLGISFEGESMDMEKIIENSLNALKENGEIRISPFFEGREDSDLEGLKGGKKVWEDFLLRVSKNQNIEFSIEPRDIFVSGKNNDVMLQSVLIIRKKK